MRPVHPHVPDKSLQRGSRGGEAFLPCQHHTSEAVSIEGAAPRRAPPAPRGHSHPKASLSTPTLAMPSPGRGVQGQEGELSGTSGFLFCWKAARCRAQCQGRGTLGTSELRAQVSPVLKTISEQLALWSFRDRAGPQHREEFEIQSRAGKQTPLR